MIIGIAGRAQVGKDTVGAMINKMTYRRFEIRKYADKLKDMTCLLIGCTRELLEDETFKSTPMRRLGDKTPRKVMQLLGTEFGRRMIDENLWVDTLVEEYNLSQEWHYPNWIVTDVRFPNEVQAIKNMGGLLIKIERDTGVDNYHSSERALDSLDVDLTFDYVINNNGSMDQLSKRVEHILIHQGII